jgi:anti-sigma B factor antagonist
MAVQDGADAFRDAVQQLVSQGRLKLVVNFQAVPYIDSTALGEMVRAYTSITRRGGSLKLLNLTRRVHKLLAMTGLLSVFDCVETERKALGSFGNS